MKKSLRRKMRSVLRSLAADLREEKVRAACHRLLAADAWRQAGTVFVHLATEHAIDTTPLVEAGWRDGKCVLVPRPVRREATLLPIRVGTWGDCVPGRRGVLEPIVGMPFPAAEIDLVVVPGLAFDHHGFQLGDGTGAYDRFLATPGMRAHRCGFGFEEQIVERLAVEPHDQRLHAVVTDTGIRTWR